MKKIGLCICYNTKNYGSMLQSLATEKKLEELGYEYEIIRYSRKLTLDLACRSIGRVPEMIKSKMKKAKIKKVLSQKPDVKQGISVRNECFDTFMNNTFLKLSPVYNTFNELKVASKQYSAVLVGSDQLWRPEAYSTGFYTLEFVPDEIKKISYATSFGVSNIPDNKVKKAKYFLNRIDYIGVRELRASELVKELTGRVVPTVVDPTVLFNAEQWEQILPSKKVESINERYIFCYLLGTNQEHRVAVNNLAATTGCKVVTIPHLDEFVEEDTKFGDYQLYNVDPAQFINLIRHAEYVCTDSFHGTVFSILNHKQFVTFSRFKEGSANSRNSRIESLLKQTELQDRHCVSPNNIISQIQADIDFGKVEDRLTQMRSKSTKYLLNALESIK